MRWAVDEILTLLEPARIERTETEVDQAVTACLLRRDCECSNLADCLDSIYRSAPDWDEFLYGAGGVLEGLEVDEIIDNNKREGLKDGREA